MQVDPLRSSKAKIKRANQHVANIQPLLHDFIFTKPHPIVHFQQVNAAGTEESIIVKLVRPLPDDIYVTVGDAINNLRNALDNLACSLAIANGATNVSQVYFPFAGSVNEFEGKGPQGKIKLLHPDAKAMIAALKPYKGGNDFLWALGRLAVKDKHQSLVALATLSGNRAGEISFQASRGGDYTFSVPQWVSLNEHGTAIMTYPTGEDVDYDFTIGASIAFGDAEVVQNQPVIATLHQFSNLVEGIVLAFENRFFK